MLLISVILITFSVFAQIVDKARLDAYFDALEKNDKFMGSIAISQKGQLVYTRSVGFADLEQGIKANEHSKYRIGSISKTFTTVLVFKAVEEGKLNLDQAIDIYFPSITNAKKITISHLLYHRSGIHNFTNDKSYLKWNKDPKTEQEIVEIISKAGSDFEPDTKTVYSNSNFVLLSYILERAYNKPYSQLLEEKIIKPTGLKDTYYGGKINTQYNECYSYRFKDGWKIESETDLSIPMGAGGIVSTPADLTTFSEALFNGGLVSPEHLAQMKTIKDHLGMGLFRIPFFDKMGFGHGGNIDGFNSLFVCYPDDDISFAYTANGLNYVGNNITIAALSAIYRKPFEIPEFKTFHVSPEDLDKYPGNYSSTQLPLKITITKKDGSLIAQATGQPAFPLEATDKNQFKFEQAGIVMEFNPVDQTMILKQGGGEYLYKKDE